MHLKLAYNDSDYFTCFTIYNSTSSFQIPMWRSLSCKMENVSERRKLPSKSKKQTNLSCQQSSSYPHHFPQNPNQLWGKPLFENKSVYLSNTQIAFDFCPLSNFMLYFFSSAGRHEIRNEKIWSAFFQQWALNIQFWGLWLTLFFFHFAELI